MLAAAAVVPAVEAAAEVPVAVAESVEAEKLKLNPVPAVVDVSAGARNDQ